MLCTQERPLILEDPLLEGLTGCIESILECLAAWQCKASSVTANSKQKFTFRGDQNMTDINRRKMWWRHAKVSSENPGSLFSSGSVPP